MPQTNGSGYGSNRPKNIRTRRIRIQIRIRNPSSNLIPEIPQRTGTLNYTEVAEMNSQADIGLPKTEPGFLNF
jgi:hypothetical protein